MKSKKRSLRSSSRMSRIDSDSFTPQTSKQTRSTTDMDYSQTYEQAEQHFSNQQHDEVDRLTRILIDLDPYRTEAWELISRNYLRLGHYNESIQCWEEVVKLKPNEVGVYYAQLWLYLLHEGMNEAEKLQASQRLMDKIRTLFPNDESTPYGDALIYGLTASEYDRAIDILKEIDYYKQWESPTVCYDKEEVREALRRIYQRKAYSYLHHSPREDQYVAASREGLYEAITYMQLAKEYADNEEVRAVHEQEIAAMIDMKDVMFNWQKFIYVTFLLIRPFLQGDMFLQIAIILLALVFFKLCWEPGWKINYGRVPGKPYKKWWHIVFVTELIILGGISLERFL
ncbi:tetratricopeptide repeat protein [Paenibacillus agilis]|uniref:Tetratricopeptide repeat protein n=1 Tax=Paenibacillus agilis TaxID=3020863 RepID=A0A559IWQ4_9BACL|nr:tetratricopeptide repeat protein [Paenibacillus agilis]TVX92057.1 tetratricopeptide repeat protein [Paenibacillus agilis]